MKADPRELLKAHYDTLVDVETGRRTAGDLVLFVGVPIAVTGVGWWFGLELPRGVLTGLQTTSGILSGFFFAAMLQVAGRAMDWAETGPEPGRATSRQARYFKEVVANAGYASLVSIAAAVLSWPPWRPRMETCSCCYALSAWGLQCMSWSYFKWCSYECFDWPATS